jgi:hypothetical protein
MLVALLVLAGCSGGDDDAGDHGGKSAREPATACELLTVQQVSDLFGAPADIVPGNGGSPLAGGTSTCLWQSGVEDRATQGVHQLKLAVYAGSEPFDAKAWGGSPETIDGLGDQAFLVRRGTLGTTAGYLEGERSVFLTYAIPLSGAAAAAAQADRVVDLLRTVEDRLG